MSKVPYKRSPVSPQSDIRAFINNELAKLDLALQQIFVLAGDIDVMLGATEGDFFLTVKGTTTAGVGTYVTNQFRYIKIGRAVFFSGRLAWSAHTGTGNMTFTGLPYLPVSSIVRSAILLTVLNQFGAVIPATDVALATHGVDEIVVFTAGTVAFQAMTAQGDLCLTGFYFTAS